MHSLWILTPSYNIKRREPIVREYGWYRSSGECLDFADVAIVRVLTVVGILRCE
jgi:hypothetical protein